MWCTATPVHSVSESSCPWGCAIAGTSFWCIPTPVHSEYDSSCMCGVCVPHRYSHRSAFRLRLFHIAPACVEATCRSERSLWVRIAVPMPPRTLQDCGFLCPWSSSKDNVPRASKQTSHFRAAPKMLGVVLYQSRASGVHPPQCIRICHELLAYTHPSAFGLRFPMHVTRLHAAGTRTHLAPVVPTLHLRMQGCL